MPLSNTKRPRKPIKQSNNFITRSFKAGLSLSISPALAKSVPKNGAVPAAIPKDGEATKPLVPSPPSGNLSGACQLKAASNSLPSVRSIHAPRSTLHALTLSRSHAVTLSRSHAVTLSRCHALTLPRCHALPRFHPLTPDTCHSYL